MTEFWPITAVLFSFGQALYTLVNQIFKLDARYLMIWRCFGIVIILTPVLFALDLPDDWRFYLAAAGVGVTASFVDVRVFHAASKFGGGVTSRLVPLNAFATFAVWLAIWPGAWESFITQPVWQVAGILFCLVVAIGAMMLFRQSSFDRSALLYLIPVILVLGFQNSFNKMAMHYGQETITAAIIFYAWEISLVAGLITLARLALQKEMGKAAWQKLKEPQMVRGGSVLVLCLLYLMGMKSLSMALAPNPGYVIVISLAAPLWVYVYNRLKKVKDQSNTALGFVFVLAVLGLVYFTVLA